MADTSLLLPAGSQESIWKGRTPLERRLVIILLLVCSVALVAIGVIVGMFLYKQTKTPSPSTSPGSGSAIDDDSKLLCVTPDCIEAAALLIPSLDLTTDPCDDFFQFACGGWMKKTDLPETDSRWGQFDIVGESLTKEIRNILQENKTIDEPYTLQLAKDFYNDCMDLDEIETMGTQPIVDLIKSEFGGWPIITEDWTSTNFDWQQMIAEFKKRFDSDWIIAMGVSMDNRNTSRNVIYLDQAGFGLPRSMLVKIENFPAILAAYKYYIANASMALAEDMGLKQPANVTALHKDIDDLVDFEISLAKITSPPEDRRNTSAMYNEYKLNELTNLTYPNVSNEYAKFNWRRYFANVFNVVQSDVNIAGDERTVVQEPEYFRNLSLVIDRTPLRTISNYLHWHVVFAIADLTNKRMRDIDFDFYKVLTGVETPEPRWKVCSKSANNKLGMSISKRYVSEYFNSKAKEEAMTMTREIQKAFSHLLHETTWMDSKTKSIAAEKSKHMRTSIAFPDWLPSNESALEEHYKGLEVNATYHYQNVLEITQWILRDSLKELRKKPDMDEWISDPTVVNAFYSPNHNSITFPAGILSPPFFYKNTPAYLSFGAMGVVIGHEITHGFDDEGRQYDKDGNERQWWTQETLNAYTDKTKCFIDQYGKYKIKELVDIKAPNDTINGRTTQGENIADNGGVRQAYRAYKNYVNENGAEPTLPGLSQYNPDQLFFISFANVWCQKQTTDSALNQLLTDAHSPSQYRVVGTLSNSEDFSRVWSCPAGSRMNPKTKCILW